MTPAPALDAVRGTVLRLFIGDHARLRKEDEQKARELHALLPYLARVRRGAHVVDAAAGKASVGLVAAEHLEVGRLTVIERDPKRVAACRAAAPRLTRAVPVDVVEADVDDASAWPARPDVVVALHACGPASDAVITRAAAAGARQLLLVPCCHGAALADWAAGHAHAIRLGFDARDALTRRVAIAYVDRRRALRLEAAGYETEVDEFVGATVTPHNVLLRAKRSSVPARMARAAAALAAQDEALTRGEALPRGEA